MNVERYTGGDYRQRNPGWHVEDAGWKAAQVLRVLERNTLRPLTVCDVGCGAGEVLRQLQLALDPQSRFVGFDVSPDAIGLASQRGNERLRFVLGDIGGWSGQPFDLLLAIDVVEHVEDCFGFLRRVRRMARNAIFHIPLELSALAVLRRHPLLASRERYGHVHYFTRGTAVALLGECGFRIRDTLFTGSGVDLPSPTFGNRVLRIPRRILFAVAPDLCTRLLGGYSLLILAD